MKMSLKKIYKEKKEKENIRVYSREERYQLWIQWQDSFVSIQTCIQQNNVAILICSGWEKLPLLSYGCTILSQLIEDQGAQPNLDWDLVQGFMHIWNHMNQGIYFNLPSSDLEGFRFMITWFNISETLISELNNLNKIKENVAWEVVGSLFFTRRKDRHWL